MRSSHGESLHDVVVRCELILDRQAGVGKHRAEPGQGTLHALPARPRIRAGVVEDVFGDHVVQQRRTSRLDGLQGTPNGVPVAFLGHGTLPSAAALGQRESPLP